MVTSETTLPSAVPVDTSHSPFGRLRPLPLLAVRLHDQFWEPRRQINRTVSLPTQYTHCEETGRFANFRRAAGLIGGEYHGLIFNDSDVYKWLEAATWTLATEDDPELRSRVDQVAALVAAAQDENGYLDTYFTGERASERWIDLKWAHELYCAGHLMQAAVAHYRATGNRGLLDVAVRLADHIADTFGPDARPGACGHPEVEMALVELARETGDKRYLHRAQFFVDQRGQQPPVISGQEYAQDHAPFLQQREVVGHAVRALYLYSGAADIYAETGEPALWQTLEALWTDLQQHKIYITGGVGSRHDWEAVGEDYELPNRRAYAETCAAIANVMWNWRMLLISGEARFADAMETALYNGMLSGISLSGDSYFYQNPLADRGKHRRQDWFLCPCCPSNLSRMLASLPGYCYSTSAEGLWVHLFAASTATVDLEHGSAVTISQETRYPWDGSVHFELRLPERSTFALFLRIPGWCHDATIRINGEAWSDVVEARTYAQVHRCWRSGDIVDLHLPMPVRVMASHPFVLDNHDRVAITRGPLVYCVEQADHPGVDVWDIQVPADAAWRVEFEPDLLNGVAVLRTTALTPTSRPDALYLPAGETSSPCRTIPLTAIPYYAWANRDPGPMQVWLSGVPATSERRS